MVRFTCSQGGVQALEPHVFRVKLDSHNREKHLTRSFYIFLFFVLEIRTFDI